MLLPRYALVLGLLGLAISRTAFAHGDHGHAMTESEKKAAEGVFNDQDVKARQLFDWDGIWQSVYPLLKSGALDPVFKQKAEKQGNKSAEEIKAYYQVGYKTTVDKIDIENGEITFHSADNSVSCAYHYDGFRILHYASGKKGVRYLFHCQDAQSQAPKFVQFSDHIIGPRKTHHFHIFTGNQSQAELLKEMDNWPTYYPDDLYPPQVVEEMLHH